MKTLYMIGGTMGVGKTTVCRKMKERLDGCVFLDGDWCWDAHPFIVTEETKGMVIENIRFLLDRFIRCSAYKSVVFCWVMHRQDIIDSILGSIDTRGCRVVSVSLVCSEDTLKARLEGDIACGKRDSDIVERSLARLPLYYALNTVKLNTDGKTVDDTADEILRL